MRILYSIQATGNGHISRALDILPHLKKYGEVDLFLSGANSSLPMDNVMYRSKGVGFFYNKKGGLDYRRTFAEFKPYRAYKEAVNLPVEDYDAVINDFESITALACKLKSKYSVGFGHQASFKFPSVPRPKGFNPIGKFVLNHYANADDYVGLHFRSYDSGNVYNPILSESLTKINPLSLQKNGNVVVYLPAYSNQEIYDAFSKFAESTYHVKWKVFAPLTNSLTSAFMGQFEFIHPNKERFIEELKKCSIVLTSAGFETPAEALFLNKKLAVIPIHGQYEQLCNAEALKEFGVPVFNTLTDLSEGFTKILSSLPPKIFILRSSTSQIIERVMQKFK